MRSSHGFSLLEVLIVLVLIALLGAVAVPQYNKIISGTKQTEAKVVLKSVHTAQKVHFYENNLYADDLSLLRIEIPSDSIYTYTVRVNESKSEYAAYAKGNIDNDEEIDTWVIRPDGKLENLVDDVFE